MQNNPILIVENIHTFYGQSHILQGINLSIDVGEVFAVLGRNGVGKTTLIRSLIGFTPPKEGKIFFKGLDITHLEPFKRVGIGLALVPQGRRIFSSLTVEENLLSALKIRKKENLWSPTKVYDFFPQLAQRKKLRASLLSGGEQQMLAIGRALVSNPELLLLDEPTEGLSPSVISELIRIIYQLERDGQSILVVEQNLQFAIKIAKKVSILSMGKVVYESTAEGLAKREDIQISYLGVSQG